VVHLVLKDQRVVGVHQDFKDLQVRQDPLDLLVVLVRLVQQVHQVLKVVLDLLVEPALLVQQDFKVLLLPVLVLHHLL